MPFFGKKAEIRPIPLTFQCPAQFSTTQEKSLLLIACSLMHYHSFHASSFRSRDASLRPPHNRSFRRPVARSHASRLSGGSSLRAPALPAGKKNHCPLRPRQQRRRRHDGRTSASLGWPRSHHAAARLPRRPQRRCRARLARAHKPGAWPCLRTQSDFVSAPKPRPVRRAVRRARPRCSGRPATDA